METTTKGSSVTQRTIPFCGVGTVPAIAEDMFDEVYGIDIDPACTEKARTIQMSQREEQLFT